ncbi:uncharacterized protein LOC129892929 [Solanum dulcamara]|uniref:uncharacterized protein LOC129892929 n=1 Tax=Solanum dulcamara TaxID=45834 RepID=UPI0024866F1C|nr:uncharacterized protein LOC129892929 [Solanum dulcamara]
MQDLIREYAVMILKDVTRARLEKGSTAKGSDNDSTGKRNSSLDPSTSTNGEISTLLPAKWTNMQGLPREHEAGQNRLYVLYTRQESETSPDVVTGVFKHVQTTTQGQLNRKVTEAMAIDFVIHHSHQIQIRSSAFQRHIGCHLPKL